MLTYLFGFLFFIICLTSIFLHDFYESLFQVVLFSFAAGFSAGYFTYNSVFMLTKNKPSGLKCLFHASELILFLSIIIGISFNSELLLSILGNIFIVSEMRQVYFSNGVGLLVFIALLDETILKEYNPIYIKG
jgi:hypothetical protein